MKELLASVIVPVYKVEEYLTTCTKSIIENAKDFLENIEVILVDDGSPDNCPKLCDELSKLYSQVKVVHKPNGGLSSARNSGVNVAKGKYLVFVDSDDSVNEKFYDMLKFISQNEYDFVECGCKYITPTEETFWQNTILDKKGLTEQDKARIFNSKLQATAWSKVVNRKFFITNNLYFREGFIHEDEHYMPRLVLKATSAYITNDFAWYNYFLRGGSIVTSYSIKNAKHILDNMQDLLPLENNCQTEELKIALIKHITRTAMGVLLRAKLIKKQDKKEYYHILKQNKNLFKKGYNFKQKMVSMVVKAFGFKFATFVIKLV